MLLISFDLFNSIFQNEYVFFFFWSDDNSNQCFKGWFLNLLTLLSAHRHTYRKRHQEECGTLYLAPVDLKWSRRSPSCCWRRSCSSQSPLPSPCGWRSSRCWRCSFAHQSSPGWASRYCLTGRKRHRLKRLHSKLAEVGEEHRRPPLEPTTWAEACVR